jgi:deoxyribodipyrimidine photo-lyase
VCRLIHEERIIRLNDRELREGDYVLYRMQSSVRAHYNHALEYAIDLANHLGKPLVACFGLTGAYSSANMRHYRYLLEGLSEACGALERRGV